MTAASVKAYNAEYLAAGGLALADAFAIHRAIHSTAAHVTLSTGETLGIFKSKNGCWRCDVVVGGHAPCKLMAQNPDNDNAAAARARAGAKITHILPLDAAGRHTGSGGGTWGTLEEDRLTRTCAAVLNADDVARHRADLASAGKRKRPGDGADVGEGARRKEPPGNNTRGGGGGSRTAPKDGSSEAPICVD